MWQHYFRGKEYPLWILGDGVESPGYSEHHRYLRRAIDNGLSIVGFIVVANEPSGPNPSVREAHTDRLFELEIVTDTAERIVGKLRNVAAR